MRKNYIEPSNKVCEIDLTSSLLAPMSLNNDPEKPAQGDGNYTPEGGGDGDNETKGESFWGSGW